MRPILVGTCLSLAYVSGQTADAPSFDVASVKLTPPTETHVSCSGGPGTTDPGLWRCSNVPLASLISYAYGFLPPQYNLRDSCCQARINVAAKVPAGASKEQFQRMQQRLLTERFKLTFHHEQKEMAIYELTVGEKGLKMKESAPDAALAPEETWTTPELSVGKDGYPVFPDGHGGLAGANGHYRWVGVNLTMQEITKTLAYHLGRPIVDATGLKGRYNINMIWDIDLATLAERAGRSDLIGEIPDHGVSGPNLQHAVQDQLGLRVDSKRGTGDIVVVDHVEKVPIEN